MSAIALVGSATLLLRESTLRRVLLPLVALAAGNFLYITAADLVPEMKASETLGSSIAHLVLFAAGLGILLLIRLLFYQSAGN